MSLSWLSFWYLKNLLLKWGFTTAALCCSGPSQRYSVTALNHCLCNTAAFSPESNGCIRRTLPCWNISTEQYSLASGITAYWRINRLLVLLFMQPTAYREVQRGWIWETAHHIFSLAAMSTCHRGSTVPMAHQTITWIVPLVSGTEISPGHIRPPCMTGSMASSLHLYLWRHLPWTLQKWTQAWSRPLAGSRRRVETWAARGWARQRSDPG